MDFSRYLDIFVADARDHLAAAGKLAAGVGGARADDAEVKELFRHLHSLKGISAAMGFGSMATVAHAAEDLLISIGEGATDPDLNCQALLLESLSCLDAMVDHAERKEAVEHPEADPLVARLRSLLGKPAQGDAAEPGNTDEEMTTRAFLVDLTLSRGSSFPAVCAARILGRLDKIGRVLRNEPSLAALRTGRFDGHLTAVIETALGSQEEVEEAVSKFDGIDRYEVRPDPARRRSAPKKPVDWVRVRADVLDALLQSSLDLMLDQGRLSTALPLDAGREIHDRIDRCQHQLRRLYAHLLELRLVPFEVVIHRLERCVRDLTHKLGKRVRFEITGRDVRLDRSLVERLVDPLLHLVRNALDHGIEPPDERIRLGKAPEGRIRLDLDRDRERVRVVVEDDGRGLDLERIRRLAVERGVRPASEVRALGDDEARMLITAPGLSTSSGSSAVSGRGVGMDVVQTTIEATGGRLRILEGDGPGLKVELVLPLSLAMIRALLVRCAGDRFVIPASSIKRTMHVDAAKVTMGPGRSILRDGDTAIELLSLQESLELPTLPATTDAMRYALVCPNGESDIGLVVDEILGRRDIMVKPLKSPLQAMPEYAGAALLEDGSVALVLDPGRLARS